MHECFPPIIVDSNISREYVNLLKKIVPGKIIYVNDEDEKYGTRGSMSDQKIKDLQKGLNAIIITQNGKDFHCGDVISLKSRKPVSYLIRQTLTELKKREDHSGYLKALKLDCW